MYKLITLLILASILAFSRASAQETNPLRIVATTTQAADLTRILVGDRASSAVEITGLMGPGVDPHLYQPTESDIQAMNRADLVIYSGLHLEGQFDTVFAALGERRIAIHRLSQPIEEAGYVMFAPGQSAVDDPHFWFDPRNWQLAAAGLAERLAELDPEYAAVYAANAESYIAQLDLLFDWALEGLSQVTASQRFLVTSHDAFQYFGTAFGWQMIGIQGISTEAEAGVGDIQAVVDFIVENQIPVIFIESSVSPKTVDAVREAVAARGHSIRPGVRQLYSDAMGASDSFGGTYIGMLAENVITILQSYEQPIPAWPAGLTPVPPTELLETIG